jgi:hypothetical protein
MMNSDNIELLTLEEYAKRFGVCRTTIFEWKKRGRLKAGRHFIKIGRVLRFFWSIDVIRDLHNDKDEKSETSNDNLMDARKEIKGMKRGSAINFEY